MTSQAYGVETDDLFGDMRKLVLAAKENNIRIVNIDKQDPARDLEIKTSMPHRYASTNFTWAENIEEDREQHPEGKYIVWGGASHLMTNETGIRGLVDEKLGIPVVAFDKRDKYSLPVIENGESKNGADFYLAGGSCYPDMQKLIKFADTNDEAKNVTYNF